MPALFYRRRIPLVWRYDPVGPHRPAKYPHPRDIDIPSSGPTSPPRHDNSMYKFESAATWGRNPVIILGQLRLSFFGFRGFTPNAVAFRVLRTPETWGTNFIDIASKSGAWRDYRIHLPRPIGARNLGGRAGESRILSTLEVFPGRQVFLETHPDYSN